MRKYKPIGSTVLLHTLTQIKMNYCIICVEKIITNITRNIKRIRLVDYILLNNIVNNK